MYVIDVIPLSRTAPGMLSYRSTTKLAPGSIVDVVLRRTKTQGIVVAATPVQEAKELLKNARFQLSKSVPSTAGSVPPEIMKAAEVVAHYHATSVGAVLSALFSELIRAGISFPTTAFAKGLGHRVVPVELPVRERSLLYAKQVAANTDAGEATLLVVPTIAESVFWKRELAVHKPLILSGTLSGERRAAALERATTHTSLIITTPSFAWVPVQNLGSIIIERVSAGTYILPKRPHLIVHKALEALAAARNVPLTIGDFPLPLELRSHLEAPMALGTVPAIATCVDARKDKDSAQADDGPWAAIPKEVITGIQQELEQGGSVVALAVRKGYAPQVVCRDCGQAQADENGMPYAFSVQGGRRFTTAHGTTSIPAARRCTRCESWNLLPLGVGVERVEEELRAAFPKAAIVVANAEQLTTAKKAAATITEGLMPGSILIGTEGLMPWLYVYAASATTTPLGVIVSADSLLALPFWRSRERFVRLCYLLSGVCREVTLVTRRPEDAAIEAVTNPTHTHFWKEEAQLRSALHYPPFYSLIHIAIEDTPARANELAERIITDQSVHTPQRLLERTPTSNQVRVPLLISIPSDQWPNATLVSYLASLPPTARVRLDPDTLW